MGAMTTNAPEYSEGFNGAVVRQVQAERAARGFTIKQLSAASGIPVRTLSRYLNFQRAMTLTHVQQLAAGVGLSTQELIVRAQNQRHG